jgi:aryl-alcohol dehydrogenase-like predicted oxidoreductase
VLILLYRKLGKNGPSLSVIGFGAWAIGGSWQYGWGSQDDELSEKSVHTALDAGINFFDTAAVYGLGHSEEIIGKALKQRRGDVVLATKCGMVWDEQGLTSKNGTYGSVLREAEASLRRLGTDYIDLYQLHWPDTDAKAPAEETMRAMEKLVQDGKVRYVGVSNYDVPLLKESLSVRHVDSLQPPYSILRREVEQSTLPFCLENGIGVVAYSPLASGLLSGYYTEQTTFEEGDWRGKSGMHTGEGLRHNVQKVEKLKKIAERLDITVAQLAIAYVLANPAITSAIVGVRKPDHILRSLPAAEVKLDEATVAEIQSIAPLN